MFVYVFMVFLRGGDGEIIRLLIVHSRYKESALASAMCAHRAGAPPWSILLCALMTLPPNDP